MNTLVKKSKPYSRCREITLGDFESADEMWNQVKRGRVMNAQHYHDEKIVKNMCLVSTPSKVDAVITTGRKLGQGRNEYIEDVFRMGTQAGLFLCPAETAIQIALQAPDLLISNSSASVAMTPISTWGIWAGGEDNIFVLDKKHKRVTVHSSQSRLNEHISKASPDREWIFLRRK